LIATFTGATVTDHAIRTEATQSICIRWGQIDTLDSGETRIRITAIDVRTYAAIAGVTSWTGITSGIHAGREIIVTLDTGKARIVGTSVIVLAGQTVTFIARWARTTLIFATIGVGSGQGGTIDTSKARIHVTRTGIHTFTIHRHITGYLTTVTTGHRDFITDNSSETIHTREARRWVGVTEVDLSTIDTISGVAKGTRTADETRALGSQIGTSDITVARMFIARVESDDTKALENVGGTWHTAGTSRARSTGLILLGLTLQAAKFTS